MYNKNIDLHGFDREYARFKVLEFIEDSYKEGISTVSIIHGNGSGILKKEVQNVLKNNKYVLDYKINMFNPGETLVKLRDSIDK